MVFYINFTWYVKLFGVNVENINFRSIIGAGKICHNEKLGVFTVQKIFIWIYFIVNIFEKIIFIFIHSHESIKTKL